MKLKRTHHDKIRSNAHKAAMRYRRRVWWADVEEMVQEAIKEQYVAARTFDPRGRTNPDDYFGAAMYRIATIAIKNMLCKASAPVSALHRPDNLKGLTSVGLMQPNESGIGERERPELGHSSTPELHAAESQLSRFVRSRVVHLLGEDGAEFAMAMLTGEFTPAEVVEEHDIAPETVYTTIRRMKDTLSTDRVLYDIWREAIA